MDMTGALLSSMVDIKSTAQTPAYNPANHGVGIVHLGLGAFHKAHQAYYTDEAVLSQSCFPQNIVPP